MTMIYALQFKAHVVKISIGTLEKKR